MEPKVEIKITGVDDPLIRRRLKYISKPDTSVGNVRPCLLCSTKTSWTVNKYPVCPSCQGKYGFCKKEWLPDPCVVCGAQGEFVCGEHDQLSLCYLHRDAWFNYSKIFPQDVPDEKWAEVWDRTFAEFVQVMKARKKAEALQNERR